jgi:hypothetical protein
MGATGPAVALNMNTEQNGWQLDHFATLGSIEAIVGNEPDDDLASTVDTRDDVETDDFPATNDDFDAQEQE